MWRTDSSLDPGSMELRKPGQVTSPLTYKTRITLHTLRACFEKSERNRVKSKAAVGTPGKKEVAIFITILTHLHTSQLFGSSTQDEHRLGLRSREEVTDLVVSPPSLPPLLNTQAPK